MVGLDKVGVVFDERLVDVDEGRRGRDAFGDGETEPMCLIRPVIRICKGRISPWKKKGSAYLDQ